jgi:hypothetical protein
MRRSSLGKELDRLAKFALRFLDNMHIVANTACAVHYKYRQRRDLQLEQILNVVSSLFEDLRNQ